jgi:hypothetical protein
MPYKEGQPLLMGCFAWIPLKLAVRKKLFGKRYITVFYYSQTLAFQYETGALLGCTMRDKLDIFHKMLVKPGTDINRSIAFIHSEAKDRLKKFIEEESKEPDTFYDFIALKELEKASKVMGISIDDDYEYKNRKRHFKDLRKLWGHELALDDVYKNILNCGLYGLGFGSSFPELTVRMYKNSYEDINMNKWAEARSHDLNIPEKPDIIPLEEREKEILQIVAAYTAEFYPELRDPLDLTGFNERILMDIRRFIRAGSRNGH